MRNLQHEQFVKLQIFYQTRIHTLLDWNTMNECAVALEVVCVSPVGDGPIPEVSAIPGRPVVRSEQARSLTSFQKLVNLC